MIGNTFNLSEVRPLVAVAGISQTVLQFPIVSEDDEPFGITIEQTRWVQPWQFDEFGQRFGLWLGRGRQGKTSNDIERLVQYDDPMHGRILAGGLSMCRATLVQCFSDRPVRDSL